MTAPYTLTHDDLRDPTEEMSVTLSVAEWVAVAKFFRMGGICPTENLHDLNVARQKIMEHGQWDEVVV